MNVSVCEMYVCYCWVSEFVRVLSCPRSVATYSSVVVSSDTAAGYARTVRVYCTWCTYVEAWVTMTKDGTHIHITVYCHAGDSATVVDESSNMLSVVCCCVYACSLQKKIMILICLTILAIIVVSTIGGYLGLLWVADARWAFLHTYCAVHVV